ncbi:MAG: glycosyltransferase family 1 protein [Chloroflexi bacterium]|nr:glycosyltransferase family 1 protein [Chloroflexota bacterium]
MNIAMLSVHTCPLAALGGKETGGMNVYVRELARELSARGHRVDIFTRSQDPAVPHEVPGLEIGARVFHVPAGPEAPYNKHRLFDYLPEFAQGVCAIACHERVQYDVYHAHYWLSGWVARELQRQHPAPIAQMFHTLGALKNRVAIGQHDRETARRIAVEREMMRRADRVVAATPRDRQQMLDLYDAPHAQITIIPPGVDLQHFQPLAIPDRKQYFKEDHNVLFVGRIDPIKGIDTWFRAMKLVVEAEPSLRGRLCVCLIGGDVDEEEPDEELARLHALKDELGIADVVTFLGKRSQESLPYYYASADVVVMPSRYESFGMVALEAMACGTPVVASDVGGLSFVVRDGETGYLVPEGNARAMADCLNRILHDPDLRARLGKRGVEVAREYAWTRIADQIEALYCEVMSARATRRVEISAEPPDL